MLADELNAVVCPYAVDDLVAVRLWYEDFGHVEDDTVAELLSRASGGPLNGQALSRQASRRRSR